MKFEVKDVKEVVQYKMIAIINGTRRNITLNENKTFRSIDGLVPSSQIKEIKEQINHYFNN